MILTCADFKRSCPMGLFSQPQSFLGVDLGAGNVKLVELRNEQGRPRLVTYGMYEVPYQQVVDNDWSKRRKDAVTILKLLLEQTKAKSRLVVSALPTFAVFSSLISVPAVSAKELPNAIRLEAKKVVPRPIDEMVLDWKEIEADKDKPADTKSASDAESGTITSAKKPQQRKILITAAPKDLVEEYLAIYKEAGLKLVSLETESFALSRSLIGKDPSVLMVVDMGARTTNLAVIEEGIPVVNRAVNFGGAMVTDEMGKRLNVSPVYAEQWKRDLGVTNQHKVLTPAAKDILDDVLHEIEYLFQLYRRQFSPARAQSSRIEKLVLAGGSAFVPGLAQYLAERLNVPVHLGDPWARIVYPEDLHPVLVEIGPSMAVSVGLAMRYITH